MNLKLLAGISLGKAGAANIYEVLIKSDKRPFSGSSTFLANNLIMPRMAPPAADQRRRFHTQ